MTTRHGAKYIDTYNAIKMDIITKQYPAGSFLPTEAELMEQYKVSRTTIRKAVALLKNDGFVTTTRGRGTEVRTVDNNEGEYPFSTLSGHTEVHTIIRGSDTSSVTAQGATVDIIDAPYQVAEALSIKEGTPIFRLQRIKLIENVPCSYVISYVTCTDFPDLDAYSGQIMFLYKFLGEHYGVTFSGTTTRISATEADFVESRLLNIAPGAAIMTLFRTTFSDDKPIEYSESYCRPDYVSTYVTISPNDPEYSSFLDTNF